MYYLTELVGKIVTIKSIRGDEYIARLIGIDSENGIITVEEPKIVYIENNQVMILPFALTAKTDVVLLSTANIFTVLKTLPDTADEYITLIDENTTEAVIDGEDN